MLTSAVHPPTLDAPGKGLPKIELLIARLMVGWQARRTTRTQAAELFARERELILGIARDLSPEVGRLRVLIRRLRGMEDSSRYWSVFMTLDHLRIVNTATTDLIARLARGQTPDRVTGTADVKPSDSADQTVVERFAQLCDAFERTVTGIDDLNTSLKWPHPWFGPLDAARWHFFTGFHMALHRRQIETILKEVGA
jgi:hypothetical protein